MEEMPAKLGIAGITDVQWRAWHAKGLAQAKVWGRQDIHFDQRTGHMKRNRG